MLPSPAPHDPADRLVTVAAAALAVVFLVIYLPDAGHGFISDDFRWIVEGRVQSAGDVIRVFTGHVGFYRPVVSLSFALDYLFWGTRPFGYGLTNLVLCLASGAGLYALARRLQLSAPVALLAAGAWLFNFHAVNMAVLWLSGRTALLVSLFSIAAAHAVAGGRLAPGALFCLLAMMSKEEAVVLPALFTAAHVLDAGWRSAARMLPLWVALAVYVPLRLYSGAFWPSDAPSYYQFAFSPSVLGRNVLEYADRAGTVSAAIAVVLVAAAGVRWSHRSSAETRVLRLAGLWIVATFALTVLLPVRSSLYALLPSVGSALAAAAIASAARRLQPRRFFRAAAALLVIAAVLIPVYRARNVRWVRLAELSQQVMTMVAADAAGRSAGHVVLIDAPGERFNLDSAFGGLFPDAVRLRLGGMWTGEIVGPETARRQGELVYRLRNGELIRLEEAASRD